MVRPHASCADERGFTYLGIMAAITLLGAVLGSTVEVWHTAVTREKERQLLFAGHQFRQAIEQYYRSTPGRVKKFPATLDELLEDGRLPGTQRYLRRIYRDPITGSVEWGLVKAEGGIAGVHSLSEAKPIKTAGFGPDDGSLEGAERYADWVFAARPEKLGVRGTANPGVEP